MTIPVFVLISVFDFSGSGAWPLDKPSSAACTVSNIGLQIGDFFSASLETPLKQLLQFLLKDFILWLNHAFQQPSNGWYTVCLPGFAVLIFVCFVVFFMGFGKVNFESGCYQHGTINCVLYKIYGTV